MHPPTDSSLPDPDRGVSGRALLVFFLLLAALTAIGLALLGDRLFDLEFSP